MAMSPTHPDFLSSPEWRALRSSALEIYENECVCCGAASKRMNVDHIVPRKVAPHLALDIRNLQLLCPFCNNGKGNKDHIDFRSDRQKQMAREFALTQIKKEAA